MTTDSQAAKEPLAKPISAEPIPVAVPETGRETVLCPHCLRTASNGIKCQGICVADSDY